MREGGARFGARRRMGERAVGAIAAAVVMAGVVAVVGASSYALLSSVSHSESSSSSVHSCVPVNAPQCAHQNSSASSSFGDAVLGIARG